MRAPTILLVSLVCVAGCGPAPEPGQDGAGGHAPALAPQDDDGSFGGDPDVDTSIGGDPSASFAPPIASSEPASGDDDTGGADTSGADTSGDDTTSADTKAVCIAACNKGPEAFARFCELVLPANQPSCKRRVGVSKRSCAAWCWWTY